MLETHAGGGLSCVKPIGDGVTNVRDCFSTVILPRGSVPRIIWGIAPQGVGTIAWYRMPRVILLKRTGGGATNARDCASGVMLPKGFAPQGGRTTGKAAETTAWCRTPRRARGRKTGVGVSFVTVCILRAIRRLGESVPGVGNTVEARTTSYFRCSPAPARSCLHPAGAPAGATHASRSASACLKQWFGLTSWRSRLPSLRSTW
jgi:hypothetical protein